MDAHEQTLMQSHWPFQRFPRQRPTNDGIVVQAKALRHPFVNGRGVDDPGLEMKGQKSAGPFATAGSCTLQA
jgi:hypothetical protein